MARDLTHRAGPPVARLFATGLRRGTLLLWLAFFMSLLVIYLLSSWLPTLLRSTGATLETAALVTAMFQVGGTLGVIVLGWLMDRIDPHLVLALTYAAAGVCIAAIGNLAATPWVAAIAVFRRFFACRARRSARTRSRPRFIRPIAARPA